MGLLKSFTADVKLKNSYLNDILRVFDTGYIWLGDSIFMNKRIETGRSQRKNDVYCSSKTIEELSITVILDTRDDFCAPQFCRFFRFSHWDDWNDPHVLSAARMVFNPPTEMNFVIIDERVRVEVMNIRQTSGLMSKTCCSCEKSSLSWF